MTLKQAKMRIKNLEHIVKDFHWMARRYVHGRSTYATSLFNEHTRDLLGMGIKLNATGDHTLWACDGMGRAYDGLTEEEATPGTPAAEGRDQV